MSEKSDLADAVKPKPVPSTRAAPRRPPTTPPSSTIFTPFNFLLVTGLAYLLFQSSEYKLDPAEIYQKGLELFHGAGGTAELSGSYAVCSKEGNQIYTSELDEPQVQCVLVNNDTIIALGHQGEMLHSRTTSCRSADTYSWATILAAHVEETAASFKAGLAPGSKGLQVHYLSEGDILTPVSQRISRSCGSRQKSFR